MIRKQKKITKKKSSVKKSPVKKSSKKIYDNIIKTIKSVTDKKLEKKPKTIHKNIFLKDVIKAESKSPVFKELSKSSNSKKNSKSREIN